MKFVIALALFFSASSFAVETGFAPVNGISMYYERYGPKGGVPLVLLHGGGSTIDVTYGRLIPHLAETRFIIAVEEQGHGRTTDRPAPVRFDTSADDVVALLKYLKIEKADIMGFSNGAMVAMQIAIRHPELVRKMIYASAFSKKSGARPEFWRWMKKANFNLMPQPLKDAYLKVNPDPAKLKTMHDKDLERMLNFKDVPDKDVKKIKASTLIIAGDQDVMKLEHLLELQKLISNSRILIVPGNHGDYLGEAVTGVNAGKYPELSAGLIDEFLSRE